MGPPTGPPKAPPPGNGYGNGYGNGFGTGYGNGFGNGYPTGYDTGYGYGQPGPGMVPSGMYFDAASGLILPQGVVLASIGRRIGAYFLAIPLLIVTLGIGYLIWGLIVWRRGQTPALQVLGMRCWRPSTGRVATWWWMALREIVGVLVEGILGFITQIVSFILLLTGKERQCLHDHIAGTVVLLDPGKVLAGA